MRVAVRLNTRKLILVLLSSLFIAGSIWIHYAVKVEMTLGGLGETAPFQEGDAPPVSSATDIQGREVVLSEFQQRDVVLLDFWAT
ncbi:MAG: hypothetical protein CME16_05700 [Gemmatimonadetes bacterium]|mgnify:FL=1|nr:hypothetical protein [Gemmatimonadota bacterium]